MDFVASGRLLLVRLLPRTKAITCEERLAMNADKPTEPVITTLKGYLERINEKLVLIN